MNVVITTDKHTHRGEPVKTGTVLDVADDLAKYMIENHLAEPIPAKEPKKTIKGGQK